MLGSKNMTRIRLEYFDQNEDFASCLPRVATVLKRIATSNVDDWYHVELDQPIEYQIKVGDPYRYRVVETNHLLIRSRWTDHPIGDIEPTSVFIVLVEREQFPLVTPLQIEKYHHVAWGMCHTLSNAAQQGAPGDAAKRRA
ncbi:MAG: hypothetical protein HQM16_01110 [Deltaproteobacteria bacterium]|nr:hypothetical protein [Deltaproteobacteria bacterium]